MDTCQTPRCGHQDPVKVALAGLGRSTPRYGAQRRVSYLARATPATQPLMRIVMPAQVGIQVGWGCNARRPLIPASAGMTGRKFARHAKNLGSSRLEAQKGERMIERVLNASKPVHPLLRRGQIGTKTAPRSAWLSPPELVGQGQGHGEAVTPLGHATGFTPPPDPCRITARVLAGPPASVRG